MAIFNEPVHFTNTVTASGATSFSHKVGSVDQADLAVAPILSYPYNFLLAVGGTPVDHEAVVLPVRAAGTVKFFYAGLNDTGTNTSLTIDLQKSSGTGGSLSQASMLGSVITINHGVADNVHTAGSLSTTAVVAGDTLIFKLVETDNTNAHGPFAVVGIQYSATPA